MATGQRQFDGDDDRLQGLQPRPCRPRGVVTFKARVCFHSAACSSSSSVHVAAEKMSSLNTAGTALARTLWPKGNRTPPFVRSPKVNRLSTTCTAPGESKQGREKTKEQSCGTCSDRPGDDVPPSGEPAQRCTAAEKRPKEPLGATGVRRRSYTSTAAPVDQKSYLWARYNDMKRLVHGKRSRGSPSFFVPVSPPRLINQSRHRGSPLSARLMFMFSGRENIFVHAVSLSSAREATQDRWHVNAVGASMPSAFQD